MVILKRDEKAFKRYGYSLSEEDLLYCLDKHIIPNTNKYYGDEYCASVTLKDKTFLPCVVFRHKRKAIDLIYNSLHKKHHGNRIGDENRPRNQDFVQKNIIEHNLSENILKFDSDVVKVEKCKYAMMEKNLISMNHFPTHYFLAKFKDGSYENFRAGEGQFYEVPLYKNLDDIVEILNSTLILKNGEIIELKNYSDWKNNEINLKKIHIEKPYFTCYIGSSNYKDFAENIDKIKNSQPYNTLK